MFVVSGKVRDSNGLKPRSKCLVFRDDRMKRDIYKLL